MRAGDVAGKGILITKALAIIGELQGSLNLRQGGEIAKNLFQLYNFSTTRLLQANLRLNPDMVQDVVNILVGLRQAFAEILPTQSAASLTQPNADSDKPANAVVANTDSANAVAANADSANAVAANADPANAGRPGLSLGGRPRIAPPLDLTMRATLPPPVAPAAAPHPGQTAAQGQASSPAKAASPVSPPEAIRPEAIRPEAIQPEAIRPEAIRPEAIRPDGAAPAGAPPAGSVGSLRLRAANAYASGR
jgi:flagellar protein FliS